MLCYNSQITIPANLQLVNIKMHETTLFLPFPPSTNTLFSGKARRFKSPAYKKWLPFAKAEIEAEKYRKGFAWKNHTGKVRISIVLVAPDKRNRDCSNYIKAIEDLLVSQGIILGDDYRYVQSVMAMWEESRTAGAFVIIEDV